MGPAWAPQRAPDPSIVGPRSSKGSHLELILVTFSRSKIRLFLLPIFERSEHRLGSPWGPSDVGIFFGKKAEHGSKL